VTSLSRHNRDTVSKLENMLQRTAQPTATATPASSQSDAPFESALRILRRQWWLILAALLLTAAAAYFYSASQEDEYTASASVLFGDPSEGITGSDGGRFQDPNRVAATNEELLSLGVVSTRAARMLGGDMTAEDIERAVSVVSTRESDIIQVEAKSGDPQRAADIANSYSRAFIAFRRDSARRQIQEAITLARNAYTALTPTEQAGDEGKAREDLIAQLERQRSLQTGGAELVQPASAPPTPSAPQPMRMGILGGIVGALLGFGLAALRERRDRTVKDTSELEAGYGRPVLAQIPRSRLLARASGGRLAGEEAESFRMLRASLRYFGVSSDLSSLLVANSVAGASSDVRSILVASAVPGEGKSTVARRLAETMAAMGDSVVLVEADMHRSHQRPDQFTSRGLSEVLIGGDLDDSLEEITLEGSQETARALTVLPSGPLPPNPSELLESERMREVMLDLRARYDMVIIDSPPLSLLSDALTLVSQVSGVLVVSALGKTTYDGMREFLRLMELLGGNLLGVVANFTPPTARVAGAYYYEKPRA